MLADVVEGFADELEDVGGYFGRARERAISADEGNGDAALFLEFVDQAARGGSDAGAFELVVERLSGGVVLGGIR